MKTSFKIGNVTIPAEVGGLEKEVKIEGIEMSVDGLSLREYATFLKEMPALIRDVKDALAYQPEQEEEEVNPFAGIMFPHATIKNSHFNPKKEGVWADDFTPEDFMKLKDAPQLKPFPKGLFDMGDFDMHQGHPMHHSASSFLKDLADEDILPATEEEMMQAIKEGAHVEKIKVSLEEMLKSGKSPGEYIKDLIKSKIAEDEDDQNPFSGFPKHI